MKKLLLMVGLMLSTSEGLCNTVYLYNGSKFTPQFSCYTGSKPVRLLDYNFTTNGSISIDGNPAYCAVINPSSISGAIDSDSNNPSNPRIFEEDLEILTNWETVYFDGNGHAAIAFYGQDQHGTDSTNVLRTCLGTNGAMC